MTEVDSQPFQSQLEDVSGPDTVFVGQNATYSTVVRVGDDVITADVIRWNATPPAILVFDTAVHATSIQVEGRAPGEATLEATVDHPDLADQEKDRPVTVLLLGVSSTAPASGDTTLTAVGDSLTVRAHGLGPDNAIADSAGLEWTHKGSAISTVPPLEGRDTLRVVATGIGTDTLVVRQGQGLCVQGPCVDTIYVRVQPEPARVEAQDSLHLGTLGSSATPAVTVFDGNDNPITGATVSWTLADPADSVYVELAPNGTVTARANGQARVEASAGTVADTTAVVVSQAVDSVAIPTASVSYSALLVPDTIQVAAFDSGGTAVTRPFVVAWTSTDTTVATVTGLPDTTLAVIEARGYGSARIDATIEGKLDSISVTVAQVVDSVVITAPADTITALTDTAQLVARGLNQNGNPIPGESFTWASRDTAVATVNATVDSIGTVTAVAEGQSFVVATSVSDSTLQDSALVVVDQVPTSVTIDPASWTFNALGDSTLFTAVARDARSQVVADATFSWSDHLSTLVEHLGGGWFRADAVGDAHGFVTVDGVTGVEDSAALTIRQIPASIVISPAADTISINGTTVLTAAVSDSNGIELTSRPAVVWTSLHPDTATIDGSGTVTGVAVGLADIVAYPDGYLDQVMDTARVRVAAYTLDFDGEDYVNAGDTLRLTTGWTMEAWVKPANSTGTQYLVSRGGAEADATAAYGIYLDAGVPTAFIRWAPGGAGKSTVVAGATALSTTGWSHVAASFDGGALKLYVNGDSVAAATSANTPQVDDAVPLVFGAADASPSSPLTGRLDEVRFWSAVRTSAQINGSYQTPLSGSEANLLAYWAFDEGSGSVTSDVVSGITAALGTATVGDAAEPAWTAESPTIP